MLSSQLDADRLDYLPRDQQLTADEFNDLDDIAVLHCFKIWSTGDDTTLASLCHGLLFHRVFKTIELTHVPHAEQLADAIKEAGGVPEYQMFFDSPADMPYDLGEEGQEPSPEILVCDPAEKLTAFSKLSPMPAAMNQQVRSPRIHVVEQWRDLARQLIAGGVRII